MNKKEAKQVPTHYNFFPKGRSGTDKLISVYWFAILFITVAAVVYMVSIFHNHPYDVRELEANILANKIADCISVEGKLDSNLVDAQGNFDEDFKDNFLETCGLNFDVEDFGEWRIRAQYYFRVDFYGIGDTSNSLFDIEKGNLNLISNCEIQKEEEYEKLAKCVEKRFYSIGDKQYLIKILSVVRKTEKNVKL